MIGVKSINKVTGEVVPIGIFDDMGEAKWEVANNMEWDEGDIISDWEFIYEPCDDDDNSYDEYDVDYDMGFDPYMGCYTDDC